jgi:hypothetical protein
MTCERKRKKMASKKKIVPWANGFPPEGWRLGQYVQFNSYNLYGGRTKATKNNPVVGRIQYLGANYAECRMANGTVQAALLDELVIITPKMYESLSKKWIRMSHEKTTKKTPSDSEWKMEKDTQKYVRRYCDCDIVVVHYFKGVLIEPGTAQFGVTLTEYDNNTTTTRVVSGYRTTLESAMFDAKKIAEKLHAEAKAKKSK